MAEDRNVIRHIAWQDVFPATLLVSAIRLALNVRSLVFAALGLVAMTAGWWVIGRAFNADVYDAFAP